MEASGDSVLKVAVGADHAGVGLKDHIVSVLQEAGHEVVDLGTGNRDRVDYPDFAHRVAAEVQSGRVAFAVLLCGSGVGMCMAANRHSGVRAAVCGEPYSAEMTRAHNDANVLCMGERVVGSGMAEAIVRAFVTTAFEGGRHAERVRKIELPDGVPDA